MSCRLPFALPTPAEAAQWPTEKWLSGMGQLAQQVTDLQQQLDWFKRQLFGQKSEKIRILPQEGQLSLMEIPVPQAPQSPPEKQIAAHTRQRRQSDFAQEAEGRAGFFDESKVPVEVIHLSNPETEGLSADDYEVIGEKVSFRLAQRPGAYVALKYVRPLIKLKAGGRLCCPPAPPGVLEGSRADVSFLAGLMIDKLAWHLPVYRQHQRLLDAGFTVSRSWLIGLIGQGANLLAPLYEAQLDSIRASRVVAIDETPIKAGQAGNGKMKSGYFWPLYGDQDEVCFPFFESRAHAHVETLLGGSPEKGQVLLSDGYGAYEAYAKKTGVTHAQCWAHCRREFFEAQAAEQKKAGEALEQIGRIYGLEKAIRAQGLEGEGKRVYRQTHSKPVVDAFFAWVQQKLDEWGLLPSNPLTKALHYARHRQGALSVFLDHPNVPVDTNHLERALRPIPQGRKNWMFCWTELGAQYVGILQSLIVTCRLQNIDPYTYLVDVLQRIDQHPAANVAQLTPKHWKTLFANNPIRAPLDQLKSIG